MIKSVGPDRLTTAALYSQATFHCEAESHPTPSYQWLQRPSPAAGPEALLRGNEPRLQLRNVTYGHQGEYVCRVTNVIGGRERVVQSEPVSLQVVGESTALCTCLYQQVNICILVLWSVRTL